MSDRVPNWVRQARSSEYRYWQWAAFFFAGTWLAFWAVVLGLYFFHDVDWNLVAGWAGVATGLSLLGGAIVAVATSVEATRRPSPRLQLVAESFGMHQSDEFPSSLDLYLTNGGDDPAYNVMFQLSVDTIGAHDPEGMADVPLTCFRTTVHSPAGKRDAWFAMSTDPIQSVPARVSRTPLCTVWGLRDDQRIVVQVEAANSLLIRHEFDSIPEAIRALRQT